MVETARSSHATGGTVWAAYRVTMVAVSALTIGLGLAVVVPELPAVGSYLVAGYAGVVTVIVGWMLLRTGWLPPAGEPEEAEEGPSVVTSEQDPATGTSAD